MINISTLKDIAKHKDLIVSGDSRIVTVSEGYMTKLSEDILYTRHYRPMFFDNSEQRMFAQIASDIVDNTYMGMRWNRPESINREVA